MLRRLVVLFAVIAVFGLFAGCDVSEKIKENQKDIAALKEEVKLIKESVSNYEKTVGALSSETDTIKREISSIKAAAAAKAKAATTVKKTRPTTRRR